MDAPLARLTYQDLDSLDPEKRWELIDGVPYAMSGCSRIHQAVMGELYVALKLHFRGRGCDVMLPPFDVKFTERDVVQPDILVSCGAGMKSQFHEGPPDLVIEIASPSSVRHDRIRKLRLYARMEVPEYWLVTPDPFMIEVLRWREGSFENWNAFGPGETLRSPRFPELEVDLAEIAANLPGQTPLPDEVKETVPIYATRVE